MILIPLLVFVGILMVLVLAHELGHFVVARIFKIGVEEFGIGFPPKIVGVKRKGILYSLNWVPLGGFVRIKGESGGGTDDPSSFAGRGVWQRALVLLAGVTMNVILAIVLLFIGLMVGLPSVVDSTTNRERVSNYEVQIATVVPNTPASTSGIKQGDRVVSLNGEAITDADQVSQRVNNEGGKEITLGVVREGATLTFPVTPTTYEGRYVLGIELLPIGIVRYPPAEALLRSVQGSWYFITETSKALGTIVVGIVTERKLSNDVGGPVAIAVLTARAVNVGLGHVLQFAALLSLNLALINVLPFPALDGGRVLFLIIEKLRRKPFPEHIEAWVHNAGFALLMVVVVLITYRDIVRFGSTITSFVTRLL